MIIFTDAGFRRLLFLLLLLAAFLPPPASAATACDTAAGEFQFPLIVGDCYRCPASYDHDILFNPDEVGVCSRVGDQTTAIRQGDSTFLCPAGQFPNFVTGKCNSCPSGYSANLDGTCTQTSNLTASYNSPFRTCSGYIDGLNGNCYACPSGYSHNPALPVGVPGVCSRSLFSAGVSCGTRFETCTTNPKGICPLAFPALCDAANAWIPITTCNYSYTGGAPSCGTLEGNTYYNCPAGYATNVLPSYTEGNKCQSTSNITASYQFSQGCAAGTFDGLNGSCYTCPSGYTHNALLPVNTPGVCSRQTTVAQTQHGDIAFLCPAGQFLDLATNDCYACQAGYLHNAAMSASSTGVCYQKLDTVASLVPPKAVGQACLGLFQGNCEAGLVCDGLSKTCRNDPPQLGEACGVLVPCSPLPMDTNPNDDMAAQGSLTCFGGRCAIKGGPGAACDSLVANSCADDLVCVLGECQHEPALRGERCDQVFSPCASVDPHLLDPATGQPQALNLACHSGNISQEFRCDTPRKIGEICGGLGRGSCEQGLLCTLSYDSGELAEIDLSTFNTARIALRCTPELQLVEVIEESLCRGWYDPLFAESVNTQPVLGLSRLTRFIGAAASAGAGATISVESGVVYGPSNTANPNGEYGCYVTTCGGVEPTAGLDASACFGYAAGFPNDGNISAQAFVKVDLAGLGSANPIPVSGGLTVGTTFNSVPQLDSVSACVFGGVGKGLAIAPGLQACTTRLLRIDTGSPPPLPPNTGSSINNACAETVSIRPKTGQLQLTWPPVAGAQSYQILRNAAGIDAAYETVVSGHQSSYATYLDEGLVNGTTYWYHVLPQDSQGTTLCTTAAASGTPVARTRTR